MNLLSGRIDPDNFGIPLNKTAALEVMDKLVQQAGQKVSKEELLSGLLRIANEKMAGSIRKISIGEGHDPASFSLVAFGGAGGQHACAVANLLKIQEVVIPYDAGLLSAYGMGMAEIERFSSRQVLAPLGEVGGQLEGFFNAMQNEAFDLLEKESISKAELYVRARQVMMRFAGQENTLEVDYAPGHDLDSLFKDSYKKLFGHWLEGETIEVESLKLIAASKSALETPPIRDFHKYAPKPSKTVRSLVQAKWQEIPAYRWEDLEEGAQIKGPALVMGDSSTIFVEDGWEVIIGLDKDAILSRVSVVNGTSRKMNTLAELELFTNRFKAVADEMGAVLRRTSFSVNVKERLDFSCAVLDSKGYLVANAPHIPVHLGSLGVCVRAIIKNMPLDPGDVAITNHPGFGGSHLPDVTLVSGVFDENKAVVGYVANRAHHAEIGGKTPGSMPANAACLAEEGVVIRLGYLVKKGTPQWNEIKAILEGAPFPTRAINENLADLNGALASIQAGVEGLKKLCVAFGTATVAEYMERLQQYSAECLANAFSSMPGNDWQATQQMDDGSPIAVKIQRNGQKISIDFGGSAKVHPGNLNATCAIVNSTVVYVLRLMIDKNIPLNEGIMRHVHINIPMGMLNPDFPDDPFVAPAVVGGNTETSQRVVDTLIKAFGFAACSQGTMNNLIFGNDHFGFYETIGGGVGRARFPRCQRSAPAYDQHQNHGS